MKAKPQVRFINKDKNQFFSVLKSRVDQYFKDNNISRHGNYKMVIKTIALLCIYITPFVLLLTLQPAIGLSLSLWAIMGVGLAGIGMSIMHDGNHESYSKNKTVNYLMGHALNLLGGSTFNWKLQHNILHHTYTNVVDMDEDIDNKLAMRFSPHGEVKWYHKLQFIYVFFFYSILTFYWITIKDFVQFYQYTRNGVNKNSRKKNINRLMRIIILKVIYFTVLFVIPITVLNFSFWSVFFGFLVMHGVAGIILSVVFQLAHTIEGTSHPVPNEKGEIENDWAIHQLNTTANFSRHNKIISWYVGGLNFQIEHHLFPRISHIHYPAISNIVKQTAGEFHIPYIENKTIWSAIASHLRLLRKFGVRDLKLSEIGA